MKIHALAPAAGICGREPISFMPDLSCLLEVTADVVCLLDAKGILQYVSPAAKNITGYNADEMIGKSLTEFVSAEDQRKILSALNEKKGTSPVQRYESRCIRKDGSIVFVSWSVRWNEKENLFYCVGRDASEQQALKLQLQKVQEVAGVATFEYDVESKYFSYISENIYAITGLSKKDFPRITKEVLCNLMHPDDRPVLQEFYAIDPAIKKMQHQYRMVRPDCTMVYLHHNRELFFDENGRHYKTFGTLQDVTQQKLSEVALQQSEKKFRTLVQGGSDMLGILSAEAKYVFLGTSVTHLLGYDPKELVGVPVADLVHPEEAENIPLLLEHALSVKYFQVPPLRLRNKEGEWRWIEASLTNFIDDPDIGGLVFNARDITEQKIINDRMLELSLIAQESIHAIIITNKQNRITWVNKAFCSLSEYSLEEVLGKMPQDIYVPQSMSLEQCEEIQDKLSRGESSQIEMRCFSKSGNPYWINLNIQPVFDGSNKLLQYLAIGKDITKERMAQEALHFSEQKFRALVQEGSDLIAIVDAQNCFTYLSDNVNRLLGYTPDELIGRNAFVFIHPEDSAETFAGIDRVKNNAPRYGVHHRWRHKNGRYIWLETKGTNHYDNPLIKGMIINARDISDRVELQKRLDGELRNKQREITSAVIQAQELERSKLGLELHDNVNQVLTTVKLYNEMYLSGYKEDRILLERSTKYLQDCINEIRSISKRLSAPTLGKITLPDSIRDLVGSVNLTNRLQIRFTHDGVDHLHISDDLHLSIYRIIQEALSNIIKYAAASEASIHLSLQNGTILLTVRDNGKGFDSKGRYTGIGLTNMKTRAEHMNGKFVLQTAPGKGCLIEVCFPFKEALVAAAS